MTQYNIHREIDNLLSAHFGTGHRPDPVTRLLFNSPLPEEGESPSKFYARQAKSVVSDLLVDGVDRQPLRELMVYLCLSLGLRDHDMWDEVLDTIREVGA
jgi:hypothetical protein